VVTSGEIGKAFSSFNVDENAIFILAAIPQKIQVLKCQWLGDGLVIVPWAD
jgi:hypothetical protein